jgi:hypothetical protein
MNISSTLLDGLRKLRLWHWQGVMHHRAREKQYHTYAREGAPKLRERNVRSAEYHYNAANFHTKQVQMLNEFFPIGDTAEKDLREKLKTDGGVI